MNNNIRYYEKTTSYSQCELFEECPRTWYMKYVQGIPGKENPMFADRGSVLHNCLEEYYKDKNGLSVEGVRKLFEEEWSKYKLEQTDISNLKEQTWRMIVNGIDLDLHNTATELKLYFQDVVGYVDLVDDDNKILYDWKSSTRSEQNEYSYKRQLKFYSWLYFRKYKTLPKLLKIYYLKYNDKERSELEHTPTIEDIKQIRNWHMNIRVKMQFYIDNPDKLPAFNKGYHWCPYKHLWDETSINPKNSYIFDLNIIGDKIQITGHMDPFLEKHIDNKYSYEVTNKYLERKGFNNATKTIRFYNKKTRSMPIGFRKQILKTLYDYAEIKQKIPIINIFDKRDINKTLIKMPDKLLSGKTLRPYQLEAVDKFVNKHKEGILEISTGGGKSLIITEIIRRLQCKSLFVIDKKELLYQMKETLEEELGLEIGIIGDGKTDIKDITVATIQTLKRNQNDFKDYLKTVRLAVFDETHHVSSESYKLLSKLLVNCEYRLGVSATARRNDGHDMSITSIVGDTIYSLTGQNLIEQGYLIRPTITFIKNINTEKELAEMKQRSILGLINEEINYHKHYDEFIVNNEKRNKKILQLANQNPLIVRKTLIVVKTIAHGELLEKLIPNSKYLHGSTPNNIRTQLMNDFKSGSLNILISTLSIFAEGIDIPSLDVVINASANKGDIKSVQVLGRVIRKHDGKQEALYYDFYDEEGIFKNAARLRVKGFKEEGHRVVINEEK